MLEEVLALVTAIASANETWDGGEVRAVSTTPRPVEILTAVAFRIR